MMLNFLPYHQEAAHHRLLPYVYSLTAYVFACAVGVFLGPGEVSNLARGGGKLIGLRTCVFLGALACFASAIASNRHTLRLLQLWFRERAGSL